MHSERVRSLLIAHCHISRYLVPYDDTDDDEIIET